jgi:hypothetical protein
MRVEQIMRLAIVAAAPAMASPYPPPVSDNPAAVMPSGDEACHVLTKYEVQPADVVIEQPIIFSGYCPSNTYIAINKEVTITVTNAPTHLYTEVTCIEKTVTTLTK